MFDTYIAIYQICSSPFSFIFPDMKPYLLKAWSIIYGNILSGEIPTNAYFDLLCKHLGCVMKNTKPLCVMKYMSTIFKVQTLSCIQFHLVTSFWSLNSKYWSLNSSHCISHWHGSSLKHLFCVKEKGPFEVVGGGKYDRRAACSEELNGGLPTISVKARTLRTFCSRTCLWHF